MVEKNFDYPGWSKISAHVFLWLTRKHRNLAQSSGACLCRLHSSQLLSDDATRLSAGWRSDQDHCHRDRDAELADL